MLLSPILLSVVPSTLASLPHVPAAPAAQLVRTQEERAERGREPSPGDPGAEDARLWRERLKLSDLEQREHEFERLVERARGDDATFRMLEEWSRDASAPELAWTARLALREARRGERAERRGLRPMIGADDGLRRRFEELEQRFGGLGDMFEELQRDMDRWWARPPAPGAGSVRRESQSYSMQVGPDGVRIEVDEDKDGKVEKRTYTGRTLDEVLEAHPQLRERIHAGGTARFFDFGPDVFRWVPRLGTGPQPGTRDPAQERDSGWDRPARPLLPPGQVRTDILGVTYRNPEDSQARELGLEDGVGLRVERVEPNTIAAALGLQAGDVVVALNGRTLRGAEDVRAVLGARAPDEAVRVEVVDPKGRRHTLTWRAPSGT